MNKILSSLLVGSSIVLASCANMGGSSQVQVSESAVINTPADQLWQLVGNFNDLERWVPGITISKQLADKRFLTLADGGEIVEREVSRDENGMTYRYVIISSPLPIDSYEATISVTPMGKDQSTVTWSSDFAAAGVSADEAKKLISGIYQAGFNKLQDMY